MIFIYSGKDGMDSVGTTGEEVWETSNIFYTQVESNVFYPHGYGTNI